MTSWSAHKAFEKAIKDYHSAHSSSPVIQLYEENVQIPVEAWEDALIKAAYFVERWGVKYLPLFERVEIELKNSRKQLRSLEKARCIVNGDFSVIKTLSRQQGYLIEP